MACQLQQHGEAVCRVTVVVCDQDAKGNSCRRLDAAWLWRRSRRDAAEQRQTQDELTPSTEASAVGFDCPAVHLHQILDQRKAEAQAFARSLQRIVDLREKFEDSTELVCGQADARITDPNHRQAAFLLHG
jgi:hypothetical protein